MELHWRRFGKKVGVSMLLGPLLTAIPIAIVTDGDGIGAFALLFLGFLAAFVSRGRKRTPKAVSSGQIIAAGPMKIERTEMSMLLYGLGCLLGALVWMVLLGVVR
jgi:hypothetical protein